METPEKRRSLRLAKAGAATDCDNDYECDAPRFFDFTVGSPAVGSRENQAPDDWFSATKQQNAGSKGLDAAQITAKKAKVAAKVAQAKKSYRHLPARSCKPLTIPTEFNLSKPKPSSEAHKRQAAPVYI